MANNYDEFSTAFDFPKAAAREFMGAIRSISQALDAGGAKDGSAAALALPGYIVDKIEAMQREPKDFRGRDAALFGDCLYEQFNVSGLRTEYDVKNGRLWIGSSEYVDMDAMCDILSWVMEKHEIQEPVCFSSCYYCDKLRADEFGGVAWAVGPNTVKAKGTQQIASDLGDEIKNELAARKSPEASK